MLKNDFYTCHNVHNSENECHCRIEFNSNHAIFKGHFPGEPVVPGVCTMEIVKELLQERVNKPLMLRSTGSVKFLQMVTPLMQPEIKITWKENEDKYSVKASLSLDNSVLFKFDGSYINNNYSGN